MSDLIIDTQIAVWYFEDSPRLSATANAALDTAIQTDGIVHISTITLVEIVYLIEKGRLKENNLLRLNAELRSPNSSFVVEALTKEISDAISSISREVVADMPDRIISATALYLGLPLVTSDSAIHKLTNVRTIW